jgi:hypothetical protein
VRRERVFDRMNSMKVSLKFTETRIRVEKIEAGFFGRPQKDLKKAFHPSY